MKGRGIEHRIITVNPCDGWRSPCSLASCHRTAAAGDTDTWVASTCRESQDNLSVRFTAQTNMLKCKTVWSKTLACSFMQISWKISMIKRFLKGNFLDEKYKSNIFQTTVSCKQINTIITLICYEVHTVFLSHAKKVAITIKQQVVTMSLYAQQNIHLGKQYFVI